MATVAQHLDFLRLTRARKRLWIRALKKVALIVALTAGLTGACVYEIRTSALQSLLVPWYAAQLSYALGSGPSPRIVFPEGGPIDDQRGYAHLADFQQRLEAKGYEVSAQARFSGQLAWLASLGIIPPYDEPAVMGLVIRGERNLPLYNAVPKERLFRSFEEIPPLVVYGLLFIENRELPDAADPRLNPVVEWDRLAKAGLLYAGSKLGLPFHVEGGSTLATQIEKYRHSAKGRTNSGGDKVRQMVRATLRVYRDGPDTLDERHRIILDYFNTVPLAATPGYGEIHGLGEGLYQWFGLELDNVSEVLTSAESTPEKARAFKHVLALLAAVRAPSFYLLRDRDALERRVSNYTRLQEQAGLLTEEFAQAVLQTPIEFLPEPPPLPSVDFAQRKATNAMRVHLTRLLRLPGFYDLDRLHVEVESTLDVSLQKQTTEFFHKITNPRFVNEHGLREFRLLHSGDPRNVIYSLMLFERTPEGNALRIHADNLDQPFDLNEGMKLELGSTAKLRTLAHYLELISLLYDEFSSLKKEELVRRARAARDPITSWVALTLIKEPKLSLEKMLDRALERKYSGSPGERFFTGGGAHYFQNFEGSGAGRFTLKQALRLSTNLVFIRLMRDLVRFHEARLPYDSDRVLSDVNNPTRHRLLADVVEEESKGFLFWAYRTYRGLSQKEIVHRLLGNRLHSARHLAIVFYAFHHGGEEETLGRWLSRRIGPQSEGTIQRLAVSYGNPQLTLSDYGYLLGRHPLELWSARELYHHPGAIWNELWTRSSEASRLAATWLYKDKQRRAQDLRLRIRIEKDAFARMTPYWQRLGFPFDRLVPTFATAIGSSSDRPAALAELMGIILNDGVRMPTVRLRQLRFARKTPYETIFVPRSKIGERVMAAPVARALREALAGVVEDGTARRLAGAFVRPDGRSVAAGGKTGSGDNRFEASGRYTLGKTRSVNRTATFVFYIGDRYFGVITAFVDGPEAARYGFTSSLPVTVMKMLAPAINQRLTAPAAVPEGPLEEYLSRVAYKPAPLPTWVADLSTTEFKTRRPSAAKSHQDFQKASDTRMMAENQKLAEFFRERLQNYPIEQMTPLAHVKRPAAESDDDDDDDEKEKNKRKPPKPVS